MISSRPAIAGKKDSGEKEKKKKQGWRLSLPHSSVSSGCFFASLYEIERDRFRYIRLLVRVRYKTKKIVGVGEDIKVKAYVYLYTGARMHMHIFE